MHLMGIVCIDCEGWHGDFSGNVSEIGITILDRRELVGVPIADWRIHHLQLRPQDQAVKSYL